MNEKKAIQTSHLTRRFGSLVAVNDLTLDVPTGTVFGFLEPNGSGKTTTIRLLLGLLEADVGRAEVLGYDVRKDAPEIRKICGALLEHTGIYERLTAYDNLDFYARINHMPKAEREARIKELLTSVDLWDRRDDTAVDWSRGMKQKLAIARTLLHHPRLVFLDEPTAGLDPLAATALREDILKLVRESGVTVFLTTHNLSEAEKICDQVAVIKEGKLLSVGSPDDLRSNRGTVEFRLVGSGFSPDILSALENRDSVQRIVPNGSSVTLSLAEGTDTAELLRWLILKGVRVEEARKGAASLEDAFLKLLNGNEEEKMRNNNLLGDIWAMVLKEWKMLFLKRGTRRNNGWYSLAVAIALIGVYMPAVTREAWIDDPTAMVLWGWMPIFWSLGIITSAIAGKREAHTLETLLASRLSDTAILIGKMMSAVLYGWGLMLVSVLIGVVVVSVAFIDGSFRFYQWDAFLAAQVGMFLMAVLFSALGVLVSLKAPTARQAYQKLSIVMLAIYIGPVMVLQFLPEELAQQWFTQLEGVTVQWNVLIPIVLALFLVLDVVLFLIAKARFQRHKLILA